MIVVTRVFVKSSAGGHRERRAPRTPERGV